MEFRNQFFPWILSQVQPSWRRTRQFFINIAPLTQAISLLFSAVDKKVHEEYMESYEQALPNILNSRQPLDELSVLLDEEGGEKISEAAGLVLSYT